LPDDPEIIEIGCVLLKEHSFPMPVKYKELVSFRSFVRPQRNVHLTGACKSLLKITQENVDSAMSFAFVHSQMWSQFLPYIEKDSGIIFCSWGNSDWQMYKKTCEEQEVKVKFLRNIDLTKVFARYLAKRDWGVCGALQLLKKSFVGQEHRALDDAQNTAIILQEIRRQGASL